MGGGSWTRKSFENYSTSRGRTVVDNVVVDNVSAQQMFQSRNVVKELSPYGVIRECCDSQDHPNSKPVIIGIDVTGSMGATAVEVAKKISKVITTILDRVQDVQFMVMGIGDLAYDKGPIQISQFESDIRIAEQLDKIWFEGNGGGNDFESYTAAWYMGSRHTKLDCLSKRGQKGLIITLGDERLNPYLPANALKTFVGDSDLQGDVETTDLYEEASQKFEIFHVHVNHGTSSEAREPGAHSTFAKCLGEDHYKVTTINGVSDLVSEIISNFFGNTPINETMKASEQEENSGSGKISWNVD